MNTGAGAVMHVLKPQPGDSYVAFGTGTVGCAGLLAASWRAATYHRGRRVRRPPGARPQSGATRTVNATDPQLVERSDASRAGVGPSGALKRRASPRPSVPRSRYSRRAAPCAL